MPSSKVFASACEGAKAKTAAKNALDAAEVSTSLRDAAESFVRSSYVLSVPSDAIVIGCEGFAHAGRGRGCARNFTEREEKRPDKTDGRLEDTQ
jgi:hypothetical protein